MNQLNNISLQTFGTRAQAWVGDAIAAPVNADVAADTFTKIVCRDAGRGARAVSALPRQLGASLAGGLAHTGEGGGRIGVLDGVARSIDELASTAGQVAGNLLGAAAGVVVGTCSDSVGGSMADFVGRGQRVGSGVTSSVAGFVTSVVRQLARVAVAAVSGIAAAIGCVVGAGVGVLHASANAAGVKLGHLAHCAREAAGYARAEFEKQLQRQASAESEGIFNFAAGAGQ